MAEINTNPIDSINYGTTTHCAVEVLYYGRDESDYHPFTVRIWEDGETVALGYANNWQECMDYVSQLPIDEVNRIGGLIGMKKESVIDELVVISAYEWQFITADEANTLTEKVPEDDNIVVYNFSQLEEPIWIDGVGLNPKM